MNKNFLIIALIFLVPVIAYWGITKNDITTQPSLAFSGPEVIKFSSPMCAECQELEKIFDEVYPTYARKINLKKIDTTKRGSAIKSLIKTYDVQLVPTTVFINAEGTVTRRIEGSMQPKILDNYLKELINE